VFHFRLTTRQLALLSALSKNDLLKRVMIEATATLATNTIIRVNQRNLRIEELLGSGLVGDVYQVQCLTSGERFALKRARANFSFFRESLRIETEIGNLLTNTETFRIAQVVESSHHLLLKDCCRQETLQQLLLEDRLSEQQREAFVAMLNEVAAIERQYGFILDLSAKNLCWQNGWILLDAGPKIHVTDFSRILANPSWPNYLAYIKEKLDSIRSSPSALARTKNRSPQTFPRAARYAFLRDWWTWLPYDESPPTNYFFAEIDDGLTEDEMLFELSLTGEQAEIKIEPQAAPRLSHNQIIQQSAISSWRQYFPETAINFAQANNRPLPLSSDSEPLTLAQLAHEVEPLGVARALKKMVKKTVALEIPTLPINSYNHWSDLLSDNNRQKLTDIFCHEPLNPPTDLEPLFLSDRDYFRLTLPVRSQDGRFCHFLCLPYGESRQVLLFTPGFRAAEVSALPLAAALMERGVAGLYVLAYLGISNREGQRLVTAGRWETILLWDTIDYLTNCLGADDVILMAASHGSIAATLVAQMHPAISRLVLDSGVLYPLALMKTLAEKQQQDYLAILAELKRHHLPQPFSLSLPESSRLKTLTLRPERDLFMDLCGHMAVANNICYPGRHAATMRHDSLERGVPAVCIDAIYRFLQE
jgi:pimeloyl-ACP methyl ester carboxylesterase